MDENPKDLSNDKANEKINTKSNKKVLVGVTIFVTILILAIAATFILWTYRNKEKEEGKIDTGLSKTETVTSEYEIKGNSIQKFDLQFMKIENAKKNMIYSPLSIKYALGMLAEGTNGESKTQITSVIGSYNYNKYENSENMSMANALFIKETFKDSIKQSYIDTLKDKYAAEVSYDPFETPTNINKWVASKTLNLIPSLVDKVSGLDFILANALGIDMEWEHKFFEPINEYYSTKHEKNGENYMSWYAPEGVFYVEFNGSKEKVSGLEFQASYNKYDIISTLGEENIKNTVKAEFVKWAKSLKEDDSDRDFWFKGDLSDTNISKVFEEFFNDYIKELKENYGNSGKTTDFEFYVDDNVKCFAKDLKEYGSNRLQYIAIMPVNEDLDKYVSGVTASDINNIISNLTTLDESNFKEGYYTHITGMMPKFKFDYELNLMEDLKTMGIKDVFEEGKADLTNLTTSPAEFIAEVKHKANIEFTQDGIKAAAATYAGGAGAGGTFDYLFDVPTITIDLTFDKPYLFLIRDKKSSEVWFVGNVYNPLLYSEDTSKGF